MDFQFSDPCNEVRVRGAWVRLKRCRLTNMTRNAAGNTEIQIGESSDRPL